MEAPGRRAIVEVRYGPMASRKAVIEPGSLLRVGRTDKADLAIAHDPQLSGVHFELTWDGRVCALADLGSATGTLLAGERAAKGEVPNGGWIRAGSTDFSVYVEGHTAPTPEEVSRLPLPLRERALAELTGAMARGPLYAVLDAARTPRVLFVLRESIEEYRSLYDGVTAEVMADASPYLVELRPDSSLLSRLVLEGWGGAWGLYFTSRRPLKEARDHLRKLVMVLAEEVNEESPKGSIEHVFFRFYDPRVLPLVLPTCTPRQRAEIFGEIDRFYCEDERGGVLRIERDQKG